jgi:uncharacterized membrane protein YedE/YeeE
VTRTGIGHLASFAAGLVFGIGLLVSGMANPARVIGFLDLAGAWDPSLAFVMAGAVFVASLAFALAARRTSTFMGTPLQFAPSRTVDARLVLGSAAFGVGWGLAGFCPGPALVALGAASGDAAVFACAMLGGMLLFERLERRAGRRRAAPHPA